MARNLVICCDGTGNEFGENDTNVLKLFQILDRDPQRQLAFYDPGVGTMSAPGAWTKLAKTATKVLGLAIGYGLDDNVLDAYRFLMDHYKQGDRVFLFGFSRGAYTVRALAGLLHKCGLLQRGRENLLPYAMKIFKHERDWNVVRKFARTFSRRCDIHFLGVWDTVSSVGWFWNPKHLPFTRTNPSVRCVRHAISIDEKRCKFRTNLWGQPEENQDVKQVWFAGVHSDVGGGYPESQSGLSKLALKWMADEAMPQGLLVDPSAYAQMVDGQPDPKGKDNYVSPDPLGPIHQSLRGPWWILEFLPLPTWDMGKDPPRRSWRPAFGRPRFMADHALIHGSVRERLNAPAANYKPANLPQDYSVVG